MSKADRRLRKPKMRQARLRQEAHQRRSQLKTLPDTDLLEFETNLPESIGSARLYSERFLSEVHALLKERDFKSAQEAQAFLNNLTGKKLEELRRTKLRHKPKWQAQELAYQALEAERASQAAALARRALKLDPDCVDALVTRAHLTARNPEEKLAMIGKAVEAGERSLGKEFFEDNKGGILERLGEPALHARAPRSGVCFSWRRPCSGGSRSIPVDAVTESQR